MKKHHEAWLAAHPTRTASWLGWILDQGFHVHHIDGDGANDDPENLVLIDASDHMMIHGRGRRYIRHFARTTELRRNDEMAYRLRQQGFKFSEVGEKIGMTTGSAVAAAARYTRLTGAPIIRFDGKSGTARGPSPDPAMPEMLV